MVVDDSIVRGNTQRALVRMLREAGAREVHVRISSPPVAWPCFYGIDFASRAELIASGLSVEEICASIGADSLAFVTLDALVGQPCRRRSICAEPVSMVSIPSSSPRKIALASRFWKESPAGSRTPRVVALRMR